MIRGLAYSRRPAAIALAGLTVALAAGLLHGRARAALRRSRAEGAESMQVLSSRLAEATPYTTARLEALRLQVRDLRGRLGDADAWSRVRDALRGQWRPEGDTAAERSGFSVRTGAFRMSSPLTSDWPGIMATVAALERIPGVGIGLLELAARGSPGPRPMDLVRVTVVVHSRRTASAIPFP